jgi:tagaturonate reductase
MKEIAPSIPYRGAGSGHPKEGGAGAFAAQARDFGLKVLDRFRNPHIQHQWISITMQYTSKMKLRVIPVLVEHYKRHNEPPVHIALGFAAWLLFMRTEKMEGWDDRSAYVSAMWANRPPEEVVLKVLGDETLWGVDLLLLKGFPEVVAAQLDILMNKGAVTALAMIGGKYAMKKDII